MLLGQPQETPLRGHRHGCGAIVDAEFAEDEDMDQARLDRRLAADPAREVTNRAVSVG